MFHAPAPTRRDSHLHETARQRDSDSSQRTPEGQTAPQSGFLPNRAHGVGARAGSFLHVPAARAARHGDHSLLFHRRTSTPLGRQEAAERRVHHAGDGARHGRQGIGEVTPSEHHAEARVLHADLDGNRP
jgi:hypothetical protein